MAQNLHPSERKYGSAVIVVARHSRRKAYGECQTRTPHWCSLGVSPGNADKARFHSIKFLVSIASCVAVT
jgi:hypothetical protein